MMKSQKIRNLKLKVETGMTCGVATPQGNCFCLEMEFVSAVELIAITCTRFHEKLQSL